MIFFYMRESNGVVELRAMCFKSSIEYKKTLNQWCAPNEIYISINLCSECTHCFSKTHTGGYPITINRRFLCYSCSMHFNCKARREFKEVSFPF